MARTVILSAVRTPIGRLNGGLSSLPATQLGGMAVREALARADVAGGQVQHVVMGSVLQAGQGQIPSRQAQIEALQALEKVGLQPDDIDLWEINEASASVTLNSIRMLGIDEDRVNVNGGAVAVGHPLGASGARIVGTLVHELRRRGGGYGCAAICSGGGQGDAIVVQV